MNDKLIYISKIAAWGKAVLGHIGSVMAVVAFATLIWRQAVIEQKKIERDARTEERLISIETKVDKTLIKEQFRQSGEIKETKELVITFYDEFQKEQKESNRWRKSYLQFVLDNTQSSDRLFRYIQGLNLQRADTVKGKPDVKLKITPAK